MSSLRSTILASGLLLLASGQGSAPLLPPPPPQRAVFSAWASPHNRSVTLGGKYKNVADGALSWPNLPAAASSAFSVVAALLEPHELSSVLTLLQGVVLDDDPDSVDALPTHELYLERSGGLAPIKGIVGKPDADAAVFESRRTTREALAAILHPVMEERVVPFVNAQYTEACGSGGCRVCHSLVRHWREGDRIAHPTHFDIQALVTVVVSLSSYGRDFTGGLYVSVGGGSDAHPDTFLALQAGDAVVHQSSLLHGVSVESGERWSWILWLKDAPGGTCESSDPTAWNSVAAAAGDPLAQFLRARRAATPKERGEWLVRSATSGFARASNELGEAYRTGTGGMPRDAAAARVWFESAAAAGEAEAVHNLAILALGEGRVGEAVSYFYSASVRGIANSFFNMGVAYFNGADGVVEQSFDAAAAWFERSGSGAALLIVSQIAAAGTPTRAPNETLALSWLQRSAMLGHVPACLQLARAADSQADALPWLARAARAGDERSAQLVSQLKAAQVGAKQEL